MTDSSTGAENKTNKVAQAIAGIAGTVDKFKTIFETSPSPPSKEQIIENQKNFLVNYIKYNSTQSSQQIADGLLKEKIDGKFLKPAAISGAIKEIKKSYEDKEQLKKIEQALLIVLDTRNISNNKVKKNFTKIGKKTEGVTEGKLVKKNKNNKTILIKNATQAEGLKGGEVCEYISTNIANVLMGENTPKFRLHVDEEKKKVKVASTFIPNFETVYSYCDRNNIKQLSPQQFKDTQGFAKLFGTAYLTGHYDLHGGNVGLRTNSEGKKEFALIDFGSGLSYHMDQYFDPGIKRNVLIHIENPQSVEEFKNNLVPYTGKSYCNSESFKGIQFAGELASFASSIDLDRITRVANLSIANLKKAYGENFLKDPTINTEIKKRMGIASNTELTEEIFVGKIKEQVTNCQKELKIMAEKELVQEVIDNKSKTNLEGFIKKLNQQNKNELDKNYQEVTQELKKQRSYISRAQIYFHSKKLTEEGLTENETKVAKIMMAQSLTNHASQSISSSSISTDKIKLARETLSKNKARSSDFTLF